MPLTRQPNVVSSVGLLIAVAVLAAPVPAATIITYNRTNTWINIPGSTVDTYSQALNGVTITVATGGGGKLINGNTAGIGVNTPGTDTSTSFDEMLSPEMLTFTFDQPVALLSFVLASLTTPEYGSYRINGGPVVNTTLLTNTFFEPIPLGTGSLVIRSNADSIYQLASITIRTPEPSGLLTLAGLGVVLLRRTRFGRRPACTTLA